MKNAQEMKSDEREREFSFTNLLWHAKQKVFDEGSFAIKFVARH